MPPIHNQQQNQGNINLDSTMSKKQYLRKTKNGNFQSTDLNNMGPGIVNNQHNRYQGYKFNEKDNSSGHIRNNIKSVDATNINQQSTNSSTGGF